MKKKAKPASPYLIQFFEGSGSQPHYARLIRRRGGQTVAQSEGYKTARARASTWNQIGTALGCKMEALDAPPKDFSTDILPRTTSRRSFRCPKRSD